MSPLSKALENRLTFKGEPGYKRKHILGSRGFSEERAEDSSANCEKFLPEYCLVFQKNYKGKLLYTSCLDKFCHVLNFSQA